MRKYIALLAALLVASPAYAATVMSQQGSSAMSQNAIPRALDGNGTQGPSACTDNTTIWSCAESVDVQGNAVVAEIANAGTTGTTLNALAKLTGAPSTAVIAATSDTTGAIGVVIGGAGTTGSAQIAISGQASCIFDGATTAGDYVQISTTTAGDCHDAGATRPTTGRIVGRVLSTNAAAGIYAVMIFSPGIDGGSSGGGNGVPFQPGFQSGMYYTTPLQQLSTYTVAANRLYAIPFYVPSATTFTKISIYIATTAAGDSCELGVYNNNSGIPSTLVTDAGNVSTATGGSAEITGATISLSAGWYWLALGCNGTPTLESAAGQFGQFFSGMTNQTNNTNLQIYGSWTYSAGGLPSNFPAVTYNGASLPLVYMRL